MIEDKKPNQEWLCINKTYEGRCDRAKNPQRCKYYHKGECKKFLRSGGHWAEHIDYGDRKGGVV